MICNSSRHHCKTAEKLFRKKKNKESFAQNIKMRLNPTLSLRQYQEVFCLQIRRSKGDAIAEDRQKCSYCNYVFFFSASEPKVPTVMSSSALNPWQTPRWSPGGIGDRKKKNRKTEEDRAQSNIYTAYRWGFFLRLRSLLAQVPDHWGTFIPETSDTSPSPVATLQRMIKLTVSDMARFFFLSRWVRRFKSKKVRLPF